MYIFFINYIIEYKRLINKYNKLYAKNVQGIVYNIRV